MTTYLEQEYQEERNILNLFPVVKQIINSTPSEALTIIKQNKKKNDIPLSEILDSFWWCMYGFLYSTEDDRVNAIPHNDYFYKDKNFKRDAESIFKCEMTRCLTKTHRYPVPKKGNNPQAKKKIKSFANYHEFISGAMTTMVNTECPSEMQTPEMFKMYVDMARSSQERLIGNDPDDVSIIRKSQFIAIGNFLDDIFIHRGYVRKIKDDGAEILTPEQLEEWDTSKTRIKQHCDNNNNLIPGFLRNMINYDGFIIQKIQ